MVQYFPKSLNPVNQNVNPEIKEAEINIPNPNPDNMEHLNAQNINMNPKTNEIG